jgi:hypothetical protein
LTLRRCGFYNPKSTVRLTPLARGNQPIHSIARRTAAQFTSPSIAVAIVTLACLAAFPKGALAAPWARTVSQDGRGATFEIVPPAARFDSVTVENAVYARVSIPGAYVADTPGRPSLPTVLIPVGVPDGMSARLRVQTSDWEERRGPPAPLPVASRRYIEDDPQTGPVTQDRFDPDPAIYLGSAAYPAEPASLGEGAPLGDVWMTPLLVRPVRYNPQRRTYSLLKRMVVRVEFVPATERERALRPALPPGAGGKVWERVQRSTLGNFDAARSFPRRAARLAPRAPLRAAAANPEFRMAVTATGMTSVSYVAVTAAGFPAGVDIHAIGITERGYDDIGDSATATTIPVVARDQNTNSIFDAGDAISFYARNLRDRVGALSIENRYTNANTYWLTWTGSPAAQLDSISGLISDPSPALPTSFRDTIHLEQNLALLAAPNPTAGTPDENIEDFFWTQGVDPNVFSNPDLFDTPIPFFDPDTTAAFRIQARYQGKANWTHDLSISFQGAGGVTDALASNHLFYDREIYLFDSGFTIPGSHISVGASHYKHVGVGTSGSTTSGSYSLLDWVDVTYSRQYIAQGNVLRFTSGSSAGIAELSVGGFTVPGVEVYDITSPTAPLRVTGLAVSPAGGGTYEAVFRTDATAGVRQFVALAPGAEIAVAAASIQRDTPSALRTPSPYPAGAFARAILVTPDAFLAPANRLADHRRSQGYVVEIATLQDIYDEFNGGIKSAAAIRRYFLHAYKTWTPGPSFALLLGDASLDYQHFLSTSSVDWVPTYLAFETIGGPVGSELVANDSYYVLNLAGGSSGASAVTPNIFLGRIPASSEAELDQFVTKLIQYESFQPTDTWRGRQMLLSDDEYSSTIFFTAGYCFQTAEAAFRAASQDMGDAAAASLSGADIRSDFFDLKSFTDPLAATCANPSNPSTCRIQGCVSDAFRRIGGAVDSFQNEVARGALLLNVQAHANRYLIAHEQIYNTSNGDLDRLANYGRPVLFLVWGCHANQFPDAQSGAMTDPTDAIGEQWLMLPDRGSIASLGSSGYELIDTNSAMNSFVADAFYSTPPAPAPPSGQPRQSRWILGEITGQAYVRNALSGSFLQMSMNRTINLLGDPMLRIDALPPRIFEVTTDGNPFSDGGTLTTDSPTDSITLVAGVRDEAGLKKTELAERPVGGAIAPLDSALYQVAVADTGRANTLTARVRPRVGNYDLLIRTYDRNDRQQSFALQVRSTARYFANGVRIVNGQFAEGNAILRADVTTPIPLTADSLTLLLDGFIVANVTKTATDATGRHWSLTTLPEERGPGTHTLDVAIQGRLGDFDRATYSVDTGFTLRGVAVVSPRLLGAGCAGSVFQFELSVPAPKVELLLMAISGRRVASLEWQGKAGFNVYCWDGRDSEGHETANGVYFYRLKATDTMGRTAAQSGRMIRTR